MIKQAKTSEGIEKTKISRQAVLNLARDLTLMVQGEIKPVRLPSERALAKKFNLSRRAVRLAVGLLEKRNLVLRRHGSGNYLLPKKFSLPAAYLILPSQLKAEDPFFSSLVNQLTLYARDHRIQLIPVRVEDEPSWNRELPGILPAKIPRDQVERLAAPLRALVALADVDTDLCCRIVFDDSAIGQEAARRIAQFGHARALMLAGLPSQAPSRLREQGFCAEARKVGLGVRVMQGKMNWRGGYDLTRNFLREGAGSVSAIFAANDWMAAGALHALAEAGLTAPRDISIVGCDDVPLAEELAPPLTTFRLDIAQLVEQTFATLEQSWRLQLPKKIVLPAPLILRESLAVRGTAISERRV